MDETDKNQESVEGEDNDNTLGDYPIDTLLIRQESRTIFDVVRRIERDDYILYPDFQRDFIWTPVKQSKLIESVLMRIPLPVFYLAENSKGKMIVVDGLQRLHTFQRFLKGDFRLELSNRELNGLSFKQLSAKLQNRIEDCNLIIYSIDSKVPPQALLDIFDRVNSGVPLTRQQMRNCLFSGMATQFLREQSQTDLFQKATGNSLRRESMKDREIVNRFCAFDLIGESRYKGYMDDFLGKTLEKMNDMPRTELKELASRLHRALENNWIVFQEHSFRKFSKGQKKRSQFNVALWDVMSTGLSKYSVERVSAKASKIKNEFLLLMQDSDFLDSISLGTNQSNRVKTRFDKVRLLLGEVFGDNRN
ncbi:MAG: DUF262 domain-containing protein [Magnetococcales bacterium]|nr:DUF262 domain-containing protein [Magnetococcales bacterium]